MDSSIVICFLLFFGVSSAVEFTWENCGEPTDPIKLTSAEAYSNSSDVVYGSGKGKTEMDITSPVQARIEIKKKLLLGWTTIPCIEKIGSCTYDDICEVNPFKDRPCPEDFERNNLPCRCPIQEGHYSATDLKIPLNILPRWVEKGQYKVEILLFTNNLDLFCLKADVTL